MKQIILMSIQPKWVAKILNGEKTVEIRKTALHEGDEVHIYCTKGKDYVKTGNRMFECSYVSDGFKPFIVNGKVVAKFIVGKCEKITYDVLNRSSGDYSVFYTKSFDILELHRKSCVNVDFIREYYLKGREGCFAIEITHLEIFDKPRELGEFKCWNKTQYETITKAPQSWCYIESEEK